MSQFASVSPRFKKPEVIFKGKVKEIVNKPGPGYYFNEPVRKKL